MSLRSSADRGPLGVALLGSTGSIGAQAVDVLEAHGDRFRVVALATGRNAAALEGQVARLRRSCRISLSGGGNGNGNGYRNG